MPDEFVEGCRVIDKARSRDERFPWVVICELPEPSEDSHRFVVWYVDDARRASNGYYADTADEARAAIEHRAE